MMAFEMARPEGFEPSTREVEARCSRPLSYGRVTPRWLAEGGGIEPLTLSRCHPSFRGSLPDRSGGTFRDAMAEGAGIELARPLRTDDGLASRCITALPTFQTTFVSKIDLRGVGATGTGSNLRPLAYKASALPTELRRRWSFVFRFVARLSLLERCVGFEPTPHGLEDRDAAVKHQHRPMRAMIAHLISECNR